VQGVEHVAALGLLVDQPRDQRQHVREQVAEGWRD
jgi:hypothetical protein